MLLHWYFVLTLHTNHTLMFLFPLWYSELFYLTLKLIVPIMSASCPWSQSLGSLQFWHLGKSQILSFLKPRYSTTLFLLTIFPFSERWYSFM